MGKFFLLVACLCGVCFGSDWTNPKCHDVIEIKLDLLRKSDYGKDERMSLAGILLGLTITDEKRNCHCLETINCGDGEIEICILHKCAEYKEAISVFDSADIQRFIVNIGSGGSKGGNSGQPLDTK